MMQNYNKIQKFLHDFVLSKKIINKSLFELEKIIYLKNKDFKHQSHIFITGLPRSGTTSLLNFLFSSDEYASLTYRNMPFVLSPNFSKLLNKENILQKERIHGDGIVYDINSPEALDEIFFNNKEEFLKKELLNYIQLILISQNKIKYLSKNNLSYKRIDLIQSILPNSLFLIPIREPLQHSYSLLNQHLHFTKLHKEDDFIRRYMNYLFHNEFGLDHKPWNNPMLFNNLNNINYWLEQWILFYEFIYKNFQFYKNCYFVIYEELSNPDYIKKILKKINLKNDKIIDSEFFINSNKKDLDVKYDKNIFDKSKFLYQNFIRERSVVK
tara:strand:- start:1540 stop:2517 length:978 start_codon:yes stop_codon:yes gene_type:complete